MRTGTFLIMFGAAVVVGLAGTLIAGGWLQETSTIDCHGCNVVYIEIDLLQANHVGAYGYWRNTTPNIDALAERSAVFHRHVAPSGHTRVSLYSTFSGMLPSQHRVLPDTIPSESQRERVRLVSEVLQDAGYRTQGITDGFNVEGHLGFDQGFDRYRTVQRTDSRVADAAAVFEEDSPFFLFYQSFALHYPYGSRGESPARFAPDCPAFQQEMARVEETMQERFASWNNTTGTEVVNLMNRRFVNGRFFAALRGNRTLARCVISDYDEVLREEDREIGRVLHQLRESGRWNETIVMVNAAHGESLGEDGSWGHGSLHNSVIHVPFILHVPGMESRDIEAYTANIDIGQTILDLLGIEMDVFQEQSLGHSLLPVLQGESIDRRFILSEYQRQRSLIDTEDSLKYFRSRDAERVFSLGPGMEEIEIPSSQEEGYIETFRDVLVNYYRNLPGSAPASINSTWPYFS